MSLLGTIVSKIFGTSHAQAAPASGSAPSGSTSPGMTPTAQTGAGSGAPAGTASAPSSAGGTSASASAGSGTQVDVNKVVGDMAAKKGQTLDWKHSIVDLLKVLDMDSSLEARKELAKELNYTGDTSDSATMNMWLSKQVMAKLAANGGKMPDDLKHS